jgi:glycosyltransferase involved in cell wall biosynthesis
VRRRRVAVLTPLPPVRSGIASYSAILLPALAAEVDVTAVVDQEEWTFDQTRVIGYEEFLERRAEFDHVICQLGNNPHHETFFRHAMRDPSIIVLHDLVQHHLIVESTLARGLNEEYLAALRASHDGAGEAWGRSRIAGFHDEIGNFLFPASADVARRSRSVIVHNRYARDMLRAEVPVPVTVVPHPVIDWGGADPGGPEQRRRLGYEASDRVVGMFGFVTAAKRPEVVLEAFARALTDDPKLALLIVGEPAPNVSISAMAEDYGIDPARLQTTGYVTDEEFDSYLAAVDVVVNLRYPSAGETSGALMHILAAGKPVAVSDYGPFAEFPPDVAARIPLGAGEVERLVEFMLRGSADAVRARAWLFAECALSRTVEGYLAAMEPELTAEQEDDRALRSTPIPLFPQLDLVGTAVDRQRSEARLTLRNSGASIVCTTAYAQPAYRLIVTGLSGDEVRFSRWVEIGGDLMPGDERVITVCAIGGIDRLVLSHGLESIPQIGNTGFASAEL